MVQCNTTNKLRKDIDLEFSPSYESSPWKPSYGPKIPLTNFLLSLPTSNLSFFKVVMYYLKTKVKVLLYRQIFSSLIITWCSMQNENENENDHVRI